MVRKIDSHPPTQMVASNMTKLMQDNCKFKYNYVNFCDKVNATVLLT